MAENGDFYMAVDRAKHRNGDEFGQGANRRAGQGRRHGDQNVLLAGSDGGQGLSRPVEVEVSVGDGDGHRALVVAGRCQTS